jgi:inorganic pyrophosphatase
VIKEFFETYKRLQKKEVKVIGFKDCIWAIKEYKVCIELMKKYGKMDKKSFLEKMKKINPKKYI